MNAAAFRYCLFVFLCICAGCASIQPPTGGPKDTKPPRLLSVTPLDSLLNAHTKRVEMYFDEYVTVTDASKEVSISPILAIQPSVTSLNKHVVVKIADTLLEPNTTYRISFGKAIKDLHEGNPFTGYTYTFSTGPYFDSLEIKGKVLDAATGLPDTGGVFVSLYNASEKDSAVIRKKPKYITKADADGNFSLKGLPAKPFRIYAVKDDNANMIYDGGKEMIGFTDRVIMPGDTAIKPILLKVFRELDTATAAKKKTDTTQSGLVRKPQKSAQAKDFGYTVLVDTSDIHKRTVEINKPIDITFSHPVGATADGRISLMRDSAGVEVQTPVTLIQDTAKKMQLRINANWEENTVYTLRLLKGFAKDTGGADAMPSKYTFRTKRDEDYGKIQVHLPAKYYGKGYVLVVEGAKDTIYQKPVTDTIVNLVRLAPGAYKMRVIVDANQNGKWDTGDLFAKRQPEDIIPYNNNIDLKPGWELLIDFDEQKKARPGAQ